MAQNAKQLKATALSPHRNHRFEAADQEISPLRGLPRVLAAVCSPAVLRGWTLDTAAIVRPALLVLIWLLCASSVAAADSLNWNVKQGRVSADISSQSLLPILEQIAGATGWQVYLEPETSRTVSAKFHDLPPGDALRLLLGDVNFALVPGTNSSARLFVFRSVRQNATQLIRPTLPARQPKIIPNELIVRLKPGMKIEDLAKKLGAKVVGKIDSLNAYRLAFEDEKAADAARAELASAPEVASVESNYEISRPQEPNQMLAGTSVSPPSLQLKDPPSSGRVIVGLIDTAVQPLGHGLDKFLLKQISVAGDAPLSTGAPLHGTSMAETILASLESMTKGATSVQILPVDVYGPNETTSSFSVALGLQKAYENGANVINMSLGSFDDSPILQAVINQLTQKGPLLIAAAGNEPVTAAFFPAAYPGVNAVTAIENGQLAPYASRGSFISLGAPGTSIVPYNGVAYAVSGTSTAAASLSGLGAAFMELNQGSPAGANEFLHSNFGVRIAPK